VQEYDECAGIEPLLAELKQAWGMAKVSRRDFGANTALLLLKELAMNLLKRMAREQAPTVAHRWRTKELRRLLILRPARLTRSGRRVVVRMGGLPVERAVECRQREGGARQWRGVPGEVHWGKGGVVWNFRESKHTPRNFHRKVGRPTPQIRNPRLTSEPKSTFNTSSTPRFLGPSTLHQTDPAQAWYPWRVLSFLVRCQHQVFLSTLPPQHGAAFLKHTTHQGVQDVRRFTLVLTAFNLLFWSADPWVFRETPARVGAFATMRIELLLLALATLRG
jgi:hypothetical protein